MTIESPPLQTPENHSDLRGSFIYDGITVDPQALYDRYASSPHGLFHAKQPARYSQSYRYGMGRDLIVDLGDDVHPVKHMLHTHDNITVPFLEAHREEGEVPFSPEEEAELRTTAILHDVGECTDTEIKEKLGFTLGDVEYGLLLEDHKEKEILIRNHIYSRYFTDIPRRLLDRVDEIDSRATEERVVRAFEVIERIGYYATAQRAASIVVNEKTKFDQDHGYQSLLRTAQLGRLALVVSNNHRSFLESQQDEFPYVRRILNPDTA